MFSLFLIITIEAGRLNRIKSQHNALKSKANRTDMEAIAESVLERQRDYLESRFDQLQQMGKDTERKLCAIQNHLMSLSESIGTINTEMGKIQSDVKGNSKLLATQDLNCGSTGGVGRV